MADDRRIVYSVSVNPQEGIQDENSNMHWIVDSDILTVLGGSNAVDINSTQETDWYKKGVQLDSTGIYPNNDASDTIEFLFVKNNSAGSDNIFLSLDNKVTYPISIPPGEAFACRLNALTADKIHIKSSANIISSEYLLAKAE